MENFKKDILLDEHSLSELVYMYLELLKLSNYITEINEMDDIDRIVRLSLDKDDEFLWNHRLTIKDNYYVVKKAIFEKEFGRIILN
jgi:hypothetical protein